MGKHAALVLRTLIVCLALADLIGCAAKVYPGPRRSRSEIARIESSFQQAGVRISILSIDGQPLKLRQDSADVLPGRHRVETELVLRHGFEQQVHHAEIWFEAKAGESYTILAENYEYGPRIWIADRQLRTVAEHDSALPPVGDGAALPLRP
jgi:hypothetical protein